MQAGMLYRVMDEDARRRLIDNLSSCLALVSRPDVIERAVEHFRRADADYGKRLTEAVAAKRKTARAVPGPPR